MKSITLVFTVLLSLNSFAQTKFSECYNAALATGYVYENQFTLIIGNQASEEETMTLENVLSTKAFSVVLVEPAGSKVRMTIKADLSDMYEVENSLEVLNNQDNIQVNCKYIQ